MFAALLTCGALAACSTASTPDLAATSDVLAGTDATVNAQEDVSEQQLLPPNYKTDPARAPFGLRATWQRDPARAMTVSWTTQTHDTTAYQPRMWYAPVSVAGQDGAKLPFEAGAFASGTGNTFGGDIGDPAIVWSVEITGLQPDTEYVYRVGTYVELDLAKAGFVSPDWSEPAIFRTATARGDRKPFTFVMAGDSRGGTDKIRANMKREAPLVGYADIDAVAWFFNGDFTPTAWQSEWNDWLDAMQPVLRSRVLMPVQGNHEVLSDVYDMFELPNVVGLPEELREHAWSVDMGNVHFVGLDSNSLEAVESPEILAWLQADLAAAAADPDIDWTIAMMHHAPYSASKHGSTDRLQEHWVPLFEAHGVDIVFSGHDHNYERTKPIRDGKIAAADTAPVYVVAGAFYAPPYSNGKDWWTEVSVHGDKGNYVIMQVDGKTMHLKAYSGDGKETLDELTFKR